MKRFLLSVFSFTDKVGKLSGYLAGLLIIFITLAICWEVFVRTFAKPTLWVNMYSIYALVGMSFIGSAFAMRQNEHIKVDILISKLSNKSRWIVEIVTYALAVIFVLLLTVSSIEMVISAFLSGKTDISAIMTPLYIPYTFVPLGSLLLILVIIGKIIENICLLKGWLETPQEKDY